MWGKGLLQRGLNCRGENGRQVSVFRDEWTPNAINPYAGRAMEHSFVVSSWQIRLMLRLFFEKHGLVLREEQLKFDFCGKVSGFGLPPKLQLFIQKVIHHIFAIKDALLRRKMEVMPECLMFVKQSQAQAEDVECGKVKVVCRFEELVL
ncbi:hypothetical protein RHMOL_Rhmol08G0037000 [Rhododendron molle]|uniref:Uncharacterized protein n=1 Tax=Rhododendron molle TaxID=49168 RepID=A0ACC0MJR3_RHOML|nr:hypothetical protein RHMOL_Rhmol08G0037000 [Rhododendron molle]